MFVKRLVTRFVERGTKQENHSSVQTTSHFTLLTTTSGGNHFNGTITEHTKYREATKMLCSGAVQNRNSQQRGFDCL